MILFRAFMLFGLFLMINQADSKFKSREFIRTKRDVTSKSTKSLLSVPSSVLLSPPTGFPEDDFIINLIKQDRFEECSLVLFQDRFDNGKSVDRILASVASFSSGMKSAYSIKYSWPDLSELESIGMRLKDLKLKVTVEEGNDHPFNITSALMSTKTLPVKFPVHVSNYRKKGDPCLIVVFMVDDIRPGFMKQIYNMLTPVYIPITRKDEDFYIFKTDSNLHKDLLHMRELPHRIKFKIAVGTRPKQESESEGSTELKISTVCFFCNPGGNPRLIELPVTEKNLPRAGIDYFPDFVWDLNGKVLYVAIPYIRAKIEADYPYEGLSNGRRGNWKMLFEKFLTVHFPIFNNSCS